MLETLDYTIRVGSTPTILYFDLYIPPTFIPLQHSFCNLVPCGLNPSSWRGKNTRYSRQNIINICLFGDIEALPRAFLQSPSSIQ